MHKFLYKFPFAQFETSYVTQKDWQKYNKNKKHKLLILEIKFE